MTVWRVDTCDCILEYNKNVNWIQSIKKCELHKNLNGQNHLEQVIAQNQRFNTAFGNIKTTDNQREIIRTAKQLNKLRIRTGKFGEQLPFEILPPPVIHSRISRLRRILHI